MKTSLIIAALLSAASAVAVGGDCTYDANNACVDSKCGRDNTLSAGGGKCVATAKCDVAEGGITLSCWAAPAAGGASSGQGSTPAEQEPEPPARVKTEEEKLADLAKLAKSNTLVGLSPSLILNKSFWKGLTLGLQSEPSETTWCYDQVEIFSGYIGQNGWKFEDYAEAALGKGETATDLGYGMNLFTFGSDLVTLSWNIFEHCHVEALIQSLGQISGDTGIAGSFLISVATEIYNYFVVADLNKGSSWFLMIDAQCKKSMTNFQITERQFEDRNFQEIGSLCGQAFSTFFQFNIPIYTVNTFGKQDSSNF